MPNSAVILRMVIAKPGEVDLGTLLEARPDSASPSPPERTPLAALSTRLGFPVLEPKLEGVRLLESSHVGPRSAYDGIYGPGSMTLWGYKSLTRVVHLEQRKILQSLGSKYFVYGPEIEVYQVAVAEGQATIVLPKDQTSLCFAIWAKKDSVLDVTFSWPVKGPVVEEFLASLG